MIKVEQKQEMDVMVNLNTILSFKFNSESEQEAYIHALQQLDPLTIQKVFITLFQENGTVFKPSRVHDFDIEVIDVN